MKVTKKQQQYLRSISHNLKPVIWLGQNGLTDNVIAEIDTALKHHELVKVKIKTGDRATRDKIISDICKATGAESIQRIGNIASIYRTNNQKQTIKLPQ